MTRKHTVNEGKYFPTCLLIRKVNATVLNSYLVPDNFYKAISYRGTKIVTCETNENTLKLDYCSHYTNQECS